MCNNKIELSVIVPVYNVAPYLERCLDSILNQTYSVGEIICVNDGSTDSSPDILKKYSQREPRVRVIHKENGGLVSARKAGLAAAKGEYATYVDSDDWIEKNMYEEMMLAMREHDADIVTSGTIRDYGTYCVSEPEHIRPGVYQGQKLKRELLANMIATDRFFKCNISQHVYNKIYKRELLKTYQMLVDDYINVGEDAACAFPCLLHAVKVVVTGKNYYHYCLRSDSIMGTKKKDELERHYVLFAALEKEGKQCEKQIPNILLQFDFLRYHDLLLQRAERVIRFGAGELFPFGNLNENEKIVIYGAGKFGMELKHLLEHRYQIAAWIDKSGKPGTQTIDYLERISFDKILIGILVSDVVEEVKRELEQRQIDMKKVLSVDYRLLIKDSGFQEL